MKRLFPVLLVLPALLAAQTITPDMMERYANRAKSDLPVGKWKVSFSNNVSEICEIGNGGESVVEEPQRRSGGMAELRGETVVITFGDDRLERWTPVGKRYVVEHWFPVRRSRSSARCWGLLSGRGEGG